MLFVSSGGYGIKARRVSREDDAEVLNERLDAYLSLLCGSTVEELGYERIPPFQDEPECINLYDSITEIDARSEPVDVYATLIGMGYVQARGNDFDPIDAFEDARQVKPSDEKGSPHSTTN